MCLLCVLFTSNGAGHLFLFELHVVLVFFLCKCSRLYSLLYFRGCPASFGFIGMPQLVEHLRKYCREINGL